MFEVEHWKSHRPNDRLAVPILGIYRHGIEPVLKDGIRTAAEFARRDGDEDPALGPARLDEKPATTHSIGALVEKLTALLGRLRMGPGQELPADTLEVLQSLHVLDESGQTFRYAAVKAGAGGARKLVAVRPDQVHFDLPAVATVLHQHAKRRRVGGRQPLVLFGGTLLPDRIQPKPAAGGSDAHGLHRVRLPLMWA